MDCVEDCGYDNLSLSRVMTRVFSLESTSLNMWVMLIYIVWIETRCIRYDKMTKQNVSWVFLWEGLTREILAKTSCHHLS